MLVALVVFFVVLIAGLIGQGIRALINSGQNKPVPLNLNHPNSPAAFYQFQNDGGTGRNNLPMYLFKNNQQAGPFPPNDVLGWLNSGQLSPEDMAIRQGEQQWQPLRTYFSPNSNSPFRSITS